MLPMLRCVVMSECPISDEDDYRVEVLIALRKRIERLDKDEYTEEERVEVSQCISMLYAFRFKYVITADLTCRLI